MEFRPSSLIFHDYGGSPSNVDGLFNPYHALVFPDGSVRYRNPANPYGGKAPHAYRLNPESIGLSYAGPVGSKPTPQALATIRKEAAKVAQMFPGIKPMSHGQAFNATKGTARQASKLGRGLDEASWRSSVVYGPPAPGQSEPQPSAPTSMAGRSLTAYAGLTNSQPQAPTPTNEAPSMPSQTGVPIPASYSPDTISAQRRMAMQLMQQGTDASPVQHWTQALARVLQGGMGGYQMAQADKQDRMMQGEGNALMGEFANALTGGPSPAGMPPPAAPPVPNQAQLLSQALAGAPAPLSQEESGGVGRFASPGLASAMPRQPAMVPQAPPVQVADASPNIPPQVLQKMLANPQTRPMAEKYILDQRKKAVVDPKAQAEIEYKKAQTDKIRQGLASPQAKASEGEKVLDRQFAKTYEDDIAGGRLADATNQLKTLEEIAGKLEAPGEANYSGPYLGLVPEGVRAFTNPDSVSVQNDIANIVQRSLRPILGAQFTEKEGENLIRRAYNPQLDEATNAKRLRRLVEVSRKIAQQKLAAAQYFEQHGTLKGFAGSANFSISDIEREIDKEPPAAGAPQAKKPTDLKSKFGLE